MYGTYTNPHFWTNLNQTLHTSPPSSGRDRRVCMVRKCLTLFYLFDLLRRERVQNPGHNMAAGAVACDICPVIRDSVICVIIAGVSVKSRKWRSRRHLPRVIRDSVISVILAGVTGSHGNDAADDTCPESSATALYPWFLRVLMWCHGNDVVAGDTCAFVL